MTKEQEKKEQVKKIESSYQKPKRQVQQREWSGRKEKWNYTCVTDWLLIRKKEKPVADIFFTYYFKDLQHGENKSKRPVTFIFNGGPGASSAYLHIGAMGPKTIVFGDQGECLPPPARLQDNPDTWLDFTDLVFVDPVGTGFSRSLEEIDLSPPGEKSKAEKEQLEFYKINRDLSAIGEFIQSFLSQHQRWSSPVFVAGESYGGFRAAKLSRKLQDEYGVGLCGAILISPALELNHLTGNDYDSLYWLENFPTMAMTAFYHQKSCFFQKDKKPFFKQNLSALLKPIEDFALNEVNRFLVQGENMSVEDREEIIKKIAYFIGMPVEKIKKNNGRISNFQFCRLLLEKERKWCGIYDTSITSYDPFPNKDYFAGADPTLYGVEHAFTHGINTLLREYLEVTCERDYRLLSLEVNQKWKQDDKNKHVFNLHIGSTDDLRYAIAMNPSMKVFICHGIFDLVTPYFSSKRIVGLMNLPDNLKKQLSFEVYYGGHMFYTWSDSRKKFKTHIKQLYNL